MKNTTWKIAAVALVLGMAQQANAFPARIHIQLANELRDNLIENWDTYGIPMIQLLGPAGRDLQNWVPPYVVLSDQDAEAIRYHPEYFRAGAIGPDNTVFPGLTDPSHAVHYAPFSQCHALLEASLTPEERAYALGCYAHGAADNASHHMVNYFTGETFTLFPKSHVQKCIEEGRDDCELSFSWENVVHHFVIEDKFLAASEAKNPEDFTEERLRHTLPKDLIKRVFLDPNEADSGLWKWFASINGLVARKNQALAASQMEGFDPAKELSRTIEDIRGGDVGYAIDERVIEAYVEFLKTGGAIEIVNYHPEGIGPADYVILLPEILSDIKKLLALAEGYGRRLFYQCGSIEINADYIDEHGYDGWECTDLTGHVTDCGELDCFLTAYLFEWKNGEPSRFQQAVERKYQEMDRVVDAYLDSVEHLSRLFVLKGMGNITPGDIREGMQPLTDSLAQVMSFPYEEMLPGWMKKLYQRFEIFRKFLSGVEAMVRESLETYILERVRSYVAEMTQKMRDLRDVMLAKIDVRILEIRDWVNEQIEQQVDSFKLKLLGLDLPPGWEGEWPIFEHFKKSVLWMNAYNTMVGTMANQEVIFPTKAGGFFAGPTSYDASWQLHYNQLALCPELAPAFYPCGVSGTEMLQPDYRFCWPFDGEKPDSPIECHRYNDTEFTTSPDQEACRKRSLPELMDDRTGHIGSYTLSFPPQLADVPPVCFGPAIVGVNDDGSDSKADGVPGDSGAAQAGGCAAAGAAGSGLPWLGLVLVLGMLRRRR